jgi:hypothetical protein
MANNAAPPQAFTPSSFPPTGFPPGQFQHPQFQQQLQRPPQPEFPGQNAGFQRSDSRGSGLEAGKRIHSSREKNSTDTLPGILQNPGSQSQPSPYRPSRPNTSTPDIKPTTPTTSTGSNSLMAQIQSTPNSALVQQAQIQNAAQAARTLPQQAQMMSPQSAARERARVTVLLEINTVLLQEVVSLQAKGMAGAPPTQPQQSPNSPTSTDPNVLTNSPVDASKAAGSKPPSPEYSDCMKRLQANLSYLATIADAKKKAAGQLPVGPAIMIPPTHLKAVHELYKRLNQLFPEASQSTINKAIAFASQQAAKPQAI